MTTTDTGHLTHKQREALAELLRGPLYRGAFGGFGCHAAATINSLVNRGLVELLGGGTTITMRGQIESYCFRAPHKAALTAAGREAAAKLEAGRARQSS